MTKINFSIQIAKKKDFKKIASIYSTEFSKYPYSEPWTPKLALSKIKKFSKYTDIFKIENEKKIIGFIIINTNIWFPKSTCLIEEMAIESKYQNQKLNQKIIQIISKIYKEKGYPSILIISKKHSRNYNLAKELGFNQIKDDIIMEKILIN